jgi:hypothetical protein
MSDDHRRNAPVLASAFTTAACACYDVLRRCRKSDAETHQTASLHGGQSLLRRLTLVRRHVPTLQKDSFRSRQTHWRGRQWHPATISIESPRDKEAALRTGRAVRTARQPPSTDLGSVATRESCPSPHASPIDYDRKSARKSSLSGSRMIRISLCYGSLPVRRAYDWEAGED